MNEVVTDPKNRTVRLLVAIASHGQKNMGFLRRIIQSYRSMAMDADVVVVSEAPKDLGPDVQVTVGLPSSNPWSLPFAHKAVFARNVDRYDLFVYSEDDMAVTEKNIQAFLRVTPALEADEIAGFLRFEAAESGVLSVPEAHGSAHWRPESVKRRGEHTIAEFTNEHAGFYILTQTQLKRAIASGNFLREPYHGRYGLPETAATDPYTCCGFRKVICISALDDFLIHHLPNRYVGRLGLPLTAIQEQVRTLVDICNGTHPATTLCETEAKVLHGKWSKGYDEERVAEVLEMVPVAARTMLSIGSGCGETELELQRRGVKIVVFPLDSVVGAAAERLGFEVVYGNLNECLDKLQGRTFDCVLITNLLHLLPNPWPVLDQSCRLINESGTLILSGPNFHTVRTLCKRALKGGDYRKLRSFEQSGIHMLRVGEIARQIKRSGLEIVARRWYDHASARNRFNFRRPWGSFVAENWVLQARRRGALS